MSLPRYSFRLQAKLLLSYFLVIAIGVGGLVVGVQVAAPSLFDRILGNMGHSSDMMDSVMSEAMRRTAADAFRTAMLQALVLATVASAFAAVVVSIVISRRITAPVTRMVAVSRRLARGDYQARVPVAEHDEVGELATSFNEMAAALEHAERRRAHLIGDVTHELRTPLATLRGYLEGLLDGVVQPSPELWAQLHGETARLSRLVDDLRDLSRLEAGHVPLHRRARSPRRLIEAAGARLAPAYADKGVSLQLDPGCTPPDVLADEDRTIQVLTNLLTNALRYTPPGGQVRVATQVEKHAVAFLVHDTGIGLAAADQPQVFERFYRVDPSRSRALGGSGVGLAIAKALVEAQGGRIWVTSEGPGQGATFGFTLPQATSRPRAPQPCPSPVPRT